MAALTTPELRPLGTGELLDRAFRLYRNHFLTLVGIVAIVLVPLTLLQIAMQAANTTMLQNSTGADSNRIMTLSLLSALVMIIVYLVQGSVPIAAVTRAVAGSYLGERVGTLDAYRKVGRRWLTVLGAAVLISLLAIVAVIWLIIPCVGWLTGPGILTYLMLVISPLVAPAVVLERRSATGAIGRSWNLTRERFWPVVGFMIVLTLLNLIFVVGPGLLVTMLTSFFMVSSNSLSSSLVASTVATSLVTLATSLLFVPFQLTATTLLYFDLRIRQEGLDLAVLASETSSETGEIEAVLAATPTTGRTRLITGNEVGYFVALTVVMALVYGVIMLITGGAMALSGGF